MIFLFLFWLSLFLLFFKLFLLLVIFSVLVLWHLSVVLFLLYKVNQQRLFVIFELCFVVSDAEY